MNRAKVQAQLDQALALAEDEETRYHIRQALQLLDITPPRERPRSEDGLTHGYDDREDPECVTIFDEEAEDRTTAWLSADLDGALVGDAEGFR